MPQMADIVIKKADGITDVTYVAIVGSSGDKTEARWENRTIGFMPAERPQLACVSDYNQPRTARRVKGSFLWPITRTDGGGNTLITGSSSGTFNFVAPQSQPGDDIKEQAYQFGNLVASAIIKASMEEGYAPRG